MRPSAIIYVSKTGHTRRYAELLGRAAGLPVYSDDEAACELTAGSEVIHMGWLHASHVKGYSDSARRYRVIAVCGVGLCDTGALLDEVRKATKIPADIPVFTLQGGFDPGNLKGMDKMLIGMLTKGLKSQKERSPEEERMLELLLAGGDYVSEDNLGAVLEWLGE